MLVDLTPGWTLGNGSRPRLALHSPGSSRVGEHRREVDLAEAIWERMDQQFLTPGSGGDGFPSVTFLRSWLIGQLVILHKRIVFARAGWCG